MTTQTQAAPRRLTWKEVLEQHAPLLLPVAHDALTAQLIQLAGYPAYQIGGIALVGARFAHPDIDLTHYREHSAIIRDIIAACDLPVLVDANDGYGDVKNVTYTVQGYEAMGASAIFLEDQVAPKRCGHMAVARRDHGGETARRCGRAAPSGDLHSGPYRCAGATESGRSATPRRALPQGGR